MRRLPSIIAAGLCICALMARGALAEVAWSNESWKTILKTAKSENKYVFIDFFTTWCGPCKTMDKETYAEEGVSGFLNGMVPVKYNAEKGAGLELAKKFRISAYPTLVLLGPEGEEIDRHVGFLNAKDFLRIMKDYQNGVGTVADFEQRVKKNPADAATWKTLGTKYADAGRLEESVAALDKYLELDPDVAGDDKGEVLYTIAETHYQGESYDKAVRAYEAAINEFSDEEWIDLTLTRLARAHNKAGNRAKCISTYMSYVNRHPDDPKALNSFAWFCATRKVGFDEALPIALKAVELSERAPGNLDTLAELYYAMGQYDKAISIGVEAARKETDDAYFTDQVKKFKKAKEEVGTRAQN